MTALPGSTVTGLVRLDFVGRFLDLILVMHAMREGDAFTLIPVVASRYSSIVLLARAKTRPESNIRARRAACIQYFWRD